MGACDWELEVAVIEQSVAEYGRVKEVMTAQGVLDCDLPDARRAEVEGVGRIFDKGADIGGKAM
jgi:hypothetical protein